MNTVKLQNQLIEKIKTLSDEQLELVANLVLKLEENSNLQTVQSAQAIEKWEYLLNHNQRMPNNGSLSNEEIEIIRQALHRQNKNCPTELAQDEIYIADDFNEPLPDEIIDLFYQ